MNPALAAALVAPGLALSSRAGNVVGSNIFNIVGILSLTAIVQPLERDAITAVDLGVMTFLALVRSARMATTRTLGRIDGLELLRRCLQNLQCPSPPLVWDASAPVIA